MLGLHCCEGFSLGVMSGAGGITLKLLKDRVCSLINTMGCECRLLIAVASLIAEHGL